MVHTTVPLNILTICVCTFFVYSCFLWTQTPLNILTQTVKKEPEINFVNANVAKPVHRIDAEILHLRPKRPHLIGGVWQVVKETLINKEIYLYSAYYDDRDTIQHNTVRVMAIIDKEPQDLYCLLWFSESKTPPVIVKTVRDKAGPWYSRHGKKFQGEVFSCGVPTAITPPQFVSIVRTLDVQPTTLLKVQIPEKIQPQHYVGICINKAYAELDLYDIVEWMEMLKIFGVSEVTMYNNTNLQNLTNIIKEYMDNSELRVFPVPNVMDDKGEETQQLMEAVIINDCLYRNLYRYRAVITMDFNEIIVPRTVYDYIELLTEVQKKHTSKHPATAYLFRNTYFFLDLPPIEGPDYLRTARYKYRVRPDDFGVSGRAMTSPLACEVLAKQTCSKIVPKYDTPGWLIDVSTDIAMNQRYEPCILDDLYSYPGICDNLTMVLYKDDTTGNFLESIVQACVNLYIKHNMEDVIFGEDFGKDLEGLENIDGEGGVEMLGNAEQVMRALGKNTDKIVKMFVGKQEKDQLAGDGDGEPIDVHVKNEKEDAEKIMMSHLQNGVGGNHAEDQDKLGITKESAQKVIQPDSAITNNLKLPGQR